MRRVLTAATFGGVILFAISAGAQTAPANAPTFSKDIAPILQAKCQACHQPGSIAPMSLVNFAETRPWAKSIKNRVSTRTGSSAIGTDPAIAATFGEKSSGIGVPVRRATAEPCFSHGRPRVRASEA